MDRRLQLVALPESKSYRLPRLWPSDKPYLINIVRFSRFVCCGTFHQFIDEGIKNRFYCRLQTPLLRQKAVCSQKLSHTPASCDCFPSLEFHKISAHFLSTEKHVACKMFEWKLTVFLQAYKASPKTIVLSVKRELGEATNRYSSVYISTIF